MINERFARAKQSLYSILILNLSVTIYCFLLEISSIIEIIRLIDVRAHITMFSQISRICATYLCYTICFIHASYIYIYINDAYINIYKTSRYSYDLVSMIAKTVPNFYPLQIIRVIFTDFSFFKYTLYTRVISFHFLFNNFCQQILALYSVKVVSITKMVQLSPTEKDASSWFILI